MLEGHVPPAPYRSRWSSLTPGGHGVIQAQTPGQGPCLCPWFIRLGSGLMSIAHAATESHVNHELNHVLKYEGCAELTLALTSPRRAVPHTSELTLSVPPPSGPAPHRKAAPTPTLAKIDTSPDGGSPRSPD